MAQRDKFNFQQITQDWGAINYKDVPSYSKTSVGTTGDAYLIRQFLKQFFPFLKTSVVKSSSSVRVKIQQFQINFTWAENGINKEFFLDAKKLEKILEPLFEGQGFDGMTDSSYSKPLPKMYNDEGFDVSYGYIYLFVDPENIVNTYQVVLDSFNLRRKKVRFYRSQVANDNSQLTFEMPDETFNYIKGIANANTLASSQTTNQSDSTSEPKQESAIVGVSPEDTTNFIRSNIYKLADKDFRKSTEAEQALASFVAKNLDVLNDMEKNAPDLLEVLSAGFKILTNYAKGNTAELSPFVPLENQQQLEDQLKEEDFDLSDVDLQEIDLTGLEEDFEINEDELGDVDLTEFEESADFVESESIPTDDDLFYAILKMVEVKELLGQFISTDVIKKSYNYVEDRDVEDLKKGGFLYYDDSTGWKLTTQGEKFIDNYELKNKQILKTLKNLKTGGKAVAVRPSPTESATINPIGTIKTGNDGNDWQVRASSKGVKRWVKIK